MSWKEYHSKWKIKVEIIKDGNYHAQNFMCSSKKNIAFFEICFEEF